MRVLEGRGGCHTIFHACGALFAVLTLCCFALPHAYAVEEPAGYTRTYSGRGQVRAVVSAAPRSGGVEVRAHAPAGILGAGVLPRAMPQALSVAAPRALASANDNVENFAGGTRQYYYAGLVDVDPVGEAARNTLIISGGTITNEAVGGAVMTSGDAYRNRVLMTNGTVRDMFGGLATAGNVYENSVEISNTAHVGNSVSGGFTTVGNAISNHVIMTGGTVDGDVKGGSTDAGDASGNTVEITGGRIGGGIFGGETLTGNASGNSVILGGTAETTHDIVGGRAEGMAAHNTVTINGGITDAVSGGVGNGGAAENGVLVTGGTVRATVTGGGSANNEVNGNWVMITGGNVGLGIDGGWSNTGRVIENSVAISGGTVRGSVAGGSTISGDALNNTVSITGGLVESLTPADSIAGGRSKSGTASGNTVELSGGVIRGIVAGGATDTGRAVNNIVTLSGTPDISGVSLFGGHATGVATDTHSGNTLNVMGFQGRMRTVGNFENYNFFLPANTANGAVILQLDDAADISGGTQATKAHITGMAGGGGKLNVGDTIHLLQSATALTVNNVSLVGGTFRQGILNTYEYTLSTTAAANALSAIILGSTTPPDAGGPSDGSISGGGIINGGSDVIAGLGMENALEAARVAAWPHDNSEPWGLGVFGVFSGGHMRYNADAPVDMDSTILVTGVVKLWYLPAAEMVAGVFFDAGFGTYTSLRRAEGRSLGADGNSRYYGGGALARYTRTTGKLRGLYAEATARAGSLTTRYNSDALSAAASRDVSYTATSPYHAGHAGLGYVWRVGEKATLDIYGKLFLTHVGGVSVDIAGDPVELEPLDSRRLRGGARFSYSFRENVSAYVGAAYEREFDGRARASAYGQSLPSTSLTGNTGIGEAGVTVSTGENNDFSLSLGVQGFTGKREGIMGSLRMQYLF